MMETRSLHPVFAAKVTGIDVSQEPDAGVIAFIEDAMAEHAVVVLSGQQIDDDAQIAWSHHFGPRESPSGPVSAFADNQTRLPKYLFDASNLDLDGEILPADHPRRVMRAGDRLWHTDSSFNPLPTKWSMLSGRIVPPDGANTEFADARAAYDALDETMKQRIGEYVVVHNLWHSRKLGGLGDPTESQWQSQPPVTHPLIRTTLTLLFIVFIDLVLHEAASEDFAPHPSTPSRSLPLPHLAPTNPLLFPSVEGGPASNLLLHLQ